MSQYNDQLDRICDVSYAGNHLLTITLVYRHPNLNLKYPDQKPKHFCFFLIAPGEQTGSNLADRTYNFDNKIVLKFSLQEIEAFSFVLKQIGYGRSKFVLPYSKFSRFENNTKSVSIGLGDNKGVPIAFVTVSAGTAKYSIRMPIYEAYALGESIHLLFESAQKKEFAVQKELQRKDTLNNSKIDTSINTQSGHTVSTPRP